MANLNLLPDYYVKERLRYRVDMIFVVLFAIVMAALIVVGKRTQRDLNEAAAEHERVVSRFSETGVDVKEFFALQGQYNKLKKDLAAYEEIRQRVSPSYVLAFITQVCPESVSLKKLRIRRPSSGDAPASSATASYLEITMDGISEDEESIGTLVAEIRQHPLTKDVIWPLSRPVTLGDQTFRTFEMSFVMRTDEAAVQAVREATSENHESASQEVNAEETEDSRRHEARQENLL